MSEGQNPSRLAEQLEDDAVAYRREAEKFEGDGVNPYQKREAVWWHDRAYRAERAAAELLSLAAENAALRKRVAELEAVADKWRNVAECSQVERDNLREVVKAIPMTADSVYVVPMSDVVWYVPDDPEAEPCGITPMYAIEGEWRCESPPCLNGYRPLVSECYSTREAALAAREGGDDAKK